MPESLLSQLANLRQLFADAAPTDPKVVSNYAWTIVKVLLQHTAEIGSVNARQLLADCIKLPIEHPSMLYSTLLAAAVKVANTYPEFRFATFISMWDLHSFRPEDNQRQASQDGKSFPSLVERSAKTLGHSLILHPEASPLEQDLESLLQSQGLTVRTMVVSRIKEALGKDGRKYFFVTLTSAEGLEVETIAHNLQPSPLRPLPEGKRHYVNIGQLYDCLVRTKKDASSRGDSPEQVEGSSSSLVSAYLSQQKPSDSFPTAIGYIEAIDSVHGHMHIYDYDSRHFVAPVQRFSRERVGDFVRFIPVIPQTSKFKTAIIIATVPATSPEVCNILRDIRITNVNKERGYATWELVDKQHPVTEMLSPLQLSHGETSPSFTFGYLNLTNVSDFSSSGDIAEGQTLRALIYLRRGKDRQKRPHVAKVFD